MRILRYFLFVIFLAALLGEVSAQSIPSSTIRGFVYNESDGEPVIFTNVYCKNTTYGSATDLNGYFVISNLPAGNYTLLVTAIGYDTLSMDISVKADDFKNLKLFVKEASYLLETVNISAEKQTFQSEVKTAVQNVTPKQIEKIPTIGGQSDLAQYLQVLPGVIFTGDQGGQLYIRGGSPVQNKVIMDGMVIYNPFHSIGLFSVFDTDILRSIDVYSGGFGAEYGGRISSIMDIRTRDGNKMRTSGKISLSTFGASAMIEGPLKKATESSPTTLTYVLSAKNSYLNYSSKYIYPYATDAENGLPFSFMDFYGKLSLGLDNGSKLNFFGFDYNDKVDNYQGVASYAWNSYGGGMNFVIIPGKTPALLEGTLAYSEYNSSMEDQDSLPRASKIAGFNINIAMSYFLGKNLIKYGVDLIGQNTVYNFQNAVGYTINQADYSTELSAYLTCRLTPGNWVIEPGMRISYYVSLAEFSPEPRVAVKYNINDNWRVKASAGLYSQNLLSATSDRDVVNLFYGFVASPSTLPAYFDGKLVESKLQKSQHIVAGVEYDPINHLTLNAEFYYKNFSQLININKNKIYDDVESNADQPESLRKDFIIETGSAKGFDLSAKYDYNRLYVWAVYSLGFVNRYDGEQTYSTHFDRRHNINILITYAAGTKQDWEFSTRWNYGSGFPFTLTAGYYEPLEFDDIFDDYTTMNGDIGLIYDDVLNAGRLPQYHRLDIDAKKTFFIGKNIKLDLSLGITNVYNRKNIFYVNRITGDRINQLPIMPNLGLAFSF
ncbi:MAG: TonB-dependent receptor [Bacteroidales bacterium]|nr:TonB-dependent receptor [Bacteroidales bacterium]